jgi:hypothetical protein
MFASFSIKRVLREEASWGFEIRSRSLCLIVCKIQCWSFRHLFHLQTDKFTACRYSNRWLSQRINLLKTSLIEVRRSTCTFGKMARKVWLSLSPKWGRSLWESFAKIWGAMLRFSSSEIRCFYILKKLMRSHASSLCQHRRILVYFLNQT